MAFFRKSDPEIKIDETSYSEWKDSGLTRFVSALTNELASSKPDYTSHVATPAENRTMADAGNRYVLEEAERLYEGRPVDRQDRRSVQMDSRPSRDPRTGRNTYQPDRLFARSGIFGARDADLSGRIPYARWPNETQPPGGCTIPGCTCGR